MKSSYGTIFLLLIALKVFGQHHQAESHYSFKMYPGSVLSCLEQLEALTDDFSLAYSRDVLDHSIHCSGRIWQDAKLTDILRFILKDTNLSFNRLGSTIVLSKKRVKNHQLYGIIRDKETRDVIPHAVVQVQNKIVRADEYGYYVINLLAGDYLMTCSTLGYSTAEVALQLHTTMKMDIELSFDNEIDVVIISTDSAERPSFHYEHYGYQYLQHLTEHSPGLGGTRDIMHTVRSLPGVQSGSGGIGGHYVRGSANGENLYLLDGATVYYPYHAFGIASIFDPVYIRDVQFYKSGHRARYGGRASSVMDVHIRHGDTDSWQALVAGSLESASLLAQGPVTTNGSLLAYGRLSTRGTIYDQMIFNTILTDEFPDANFSDILVKYADGIAPNHQFSATYYNGGDHIRGDQSVDLSNEISKNFTSDLQWGTSILTSQLRSNFSPNTLMNIRGFRSSFRTRYRDLFTTKSTDGLETGENVYTSVGSRVEDIGLSASLDHHSRLLGDLQVGWQYTWHRLTPDIRSLKNSEIKEISGDITLALDDIDTDDGKALFATSGAIYLEQRISMRRWSGELGLRLSSFSHNGSNYYDLQPRASLTYEYDTKANVTASISRMVQYIHLLPYSSINLPRDIWLPSGDALSPEYTWHYDIGWHTGISSIDIDANVYYKTTEGLIAFDPNLSRLDQGSPAAAFRQGEGISYGIEVNISKKYNRLRGNVAYSYANSRREVDGFNMDFDYPFQFDRRHELKILSTYQLSDALSFGLSGYIGSANPKLFSVNSSLGSGIDQADSSSQGNKNSQRAQPAYRIDFSVQYQKEKMGLKHSIKAGVYNITGSQNPVLHITDRALSSSVPGFSIPLTPFIRYSIYF